MRTSLTRRLLGGMLVVLLVSGGVAGAQTPPVRPRAQTVSTDTPEIAALRVKANAGDADAQSNLGYAYVVGQGVPQDYAQAALWLRKAAEQGLADAQCELGAAYYKGEGVPQDFAQAVAWTRKAAEQGLDKAQHTLGISYDNGLGVPLDYEQAAAWYRKAAEQGFAKSQFNLGIAYYIGQGVPQDYVEAHKWGNLAVSRLSGKEQKRFAEERDDLAQTMTPTQLEAAQTLAREWVAAFQKRGGK
jgi:Sel1 repeat